MNLTIHPIYGILHESKESNRPLGTTMIETKSALKAVGHLVKEIPLVRAVIRQLGYRALTVECLELLMDVHKGGADAGWHGFITTSETWDFTRRNWAHIVKEMSNLSDDLGGTITCMVEKWRCMEAHSLRKIEAALLAGKPKPFKQTNVYYSEAQEALFQSLAWFALETVAQLLTSALQTREKSLMA